MFFWLSLTALASPGSAGALHLGALPLPAGTGFAGIGGGIAWFGGAVAVAPVGEVGAAFGDRAAVTATIAAAFPGPPAAAPLLVSGRYLAVNQDDLRLAVTLSGLVIPYFRSEEPTDLETHLTPGLAVDAGGENIRFDAAIPIWGVSSYNQFFGLERFPVPLVSTIGVSFAVGEHQRLRIGLPEGLSWHLRSEHVYVDVGGATVVLAGAVWMKVGTVF